MEYGVMPKLNQYTENKALDLLKVQSSANSAKVSENDQLKKLQTEFLDEKIDVIQPKKVESDIKTPKFEYTLTNTNFGFNDASKDFYVKAIRGKAENQYPTEDLMRLKAYMMSLANQEISAS